MDLQETIDAVLAMVCDKARKMDDPTDIIVDARQRLMLVCLTCMASENDNLLSHLPPLELHLEEED